MLRDCQQVDLLVIITYNTVTRRLRGSSTLSVTHIEQQREGLDAILRSRTFHRCDQLKRFLKFVCDAEWDGRRQDLTEYEVAVRALGRPPDFNPEFDSSVRTRAHALRQKLNEYYAKEAPESAVRIELPRGSYIPVFQVCNADVEPAPPRSVAVPLPQSSDTLEIVPPNLASPYSAAPWQYFALGLACAGVCVAAAFAFGWVTPARPDTLAPVVRDFWRPWLNGIHRATICVSQPPHLWVRDYYDQPLPTQYDPFPDEAPSSQQFLRWYSGRTTYSPNSRLVLHPSPNSPLWGDAAGGASAIQFLAKSGVDAQLLPEKTLHSVYPLRKQNTMIFGRPEFSPLMREYTDLGGFQVRYLPQARRHAIVHTGDPEHRYHNSLQKDQENYGLITVISADAARPRSVILFSGITSDGSQAGIEFLTSAPHLTLLKEKLAASGHRDWPNRFQVVVKARSSDGYPVEIAYVEHVVLP